MLESPSISQGSLVWVRELAVENYIKSGTRSSDGIIFFFNLGLLTGFANWWDLVSFHLIWQNLDSVRSSVRNSLPSGTGGRCCEKISAPWRSEFLDFQYIRLRSKRRQRRLRPFTIGNPMVLTNWLLVSAGFSNIITQISFWLVQGS